jgi:hypothetical protein
MYGLLLADQVVSPVMGPPTSVTACATIGHKSRMSMQALFRMVTSFVFLLFRQNKERFIPLCGEYTPLALGIKRLPSRMRDKMC